MTICQYRLHIKRTTAHYMVLPNSVPNGQFGDTDDTNNHLMDLDGFI